MVSNKKWDDEHTQLERRLELQRLLHSSPGGFTASELARKLNCSSRTVQRDLDYFRSLLDETGLVDPLEAKEDRYRLRPGEFPLPLLQLDKNEARALLFSLRLLSQSSTEQDADAATLLDKLAAVFPGPLAQQVAFTRGSFGQRPLDREQTKRLHLLSDAWMAAEIVVMRYRAVGRDAPSKVCFEPYLLEPSASTGATYLIGYNHTRGRIGTYKLDRVEKVDKHHKLLCPDALERHLPVAREDSAELMARIARSWSGVVLADGDFEAVIDFRGDSAIRARESRWHPDSTFTPLGDGRVRMTIRLPELFDFLPWVLSWGNEAEVVAPERLVEMVRELR